MGFNKNVFKPNTSNLYNMMTIYFALQTKSLLPYLLFLRSDGQTTDSLTPLAYLSYIRSTASNYLLNICPTTGVAVFADGFMNANGMKAKMSRRAGTCKVDVKQQLQMGID